MGNPKNHNRNVHAMVAHGGDRWDLNCAYNFLSAVKSCCSRSIIPHALSTCNRDELSSLTGSTNKDGSQDAQPKPPQPPHASFLEPGVVTPITDSEILPEILQSDDTPTANEEGFLPGNPLPQTIPTPQETQEILEVLRPFYRCVQQEDLKLELRSHLQALALKLKPSSRLLVMTCAQTVNTSGCIVLGRTIAN
ncbi:uncharacterized protein DFL_002157 [Arthrobotrys flagrans]|uniref:Uncharacterized protein n=1 Tax=Arthrobotrys flagrans TaxID=97331 RepID=A0A437A9Q6_ARTFL|nr:hypothetical protein DFL_002157 [Arthrobotrys flagrans]